MILQEIDKVSVTILMDNSTDLLLTNSIHAKRPQLTTNEKYLLPLPIAEHGFSALVDIMYRVKKRMKKIICVKKSNIKITTVYSCLMQVLAKMV